ncbi:hypothetical protein CkaCkLH20_11042 [Colletotrichum karsti]|uniref:Ankyrin repeat protein n=1 Tax=Colletotrichum karsti TaxID=1095194 RepID=A0A9P6LGA2_9PEZI|nr:uncharacterized protein CkaCkLH20_11042 [Colletotrichum karsti]KAF9871395.1 hypothetical protein CkaCkLH20_11042 [Colletotrichum karsti]
MDELIDTVVAANRLIHTVCKTRLVSPYLENLPTDLVLAIVDQLLTTDETNSYEQEATFDWGYTPKPEECDPLFDGVRAATRLASTCKRIRAVADRAIIHHDIRHHHSSCLLLSSKRGCAGGVAKALRYGADINALDRTVFEFWFVDKDSYEYMCRSPTRSTLTALHWAAFYGHEDLVGYLLEHGADVDARANIAVEAEGPDARWGVCNLGESHIQYAMLSHTQEDYESGNNFVEFDLDQEAPVSPDNPRGEDRITVTGDAMKTLGVGASPLFLALKACTKDTARRRYGPAKWNWEEHTPIVTDDDTGCRAAIVRKLVGAGASLITGTKSRTHALHQACAYRDFDVVDFLVSEMGVDANVADEKGATAAHYMAMHTTYALGWGERGRIDFSDQNQALILQLLLSRGLNLHHLNSDGLTAMDMGLDIAGVDLTSCSPTKCVTISSSPMSSPLKSFSPTSSSPTSSPSTSFSPTNRSTTY